MKISPYQTPELRNESDAVIQVGTYGKYTPFANADNTGILDYINNNLEALKNALSGAYVYVKDKSSLPASGDVTKIYVTQDDGKSYKWTGTEWSLLTSQLNGLSAYEIAQTLGFTGTEEEWITSLGTDTISSATVDSEGYLTMHMKGGADIKTPLQPIIDCIKYRDSAISAEQNATSQAQNASNSATSASNSAKASSVSEGNAKTSADNAKTSETNAKTSETNAGASATNASNSASNAATSATNAEASNQSAKKWAESSSSPDGATDTDSSTGKTQSAKSWALAAKASEANAKTSETNAKTSETNAANSARTLQADWNATDTTLQSYIKNKPESVKIKYSLDLSSLDSTKFYPVVFDSTDIIHHCEIYSIGGMDSKPYNRNMISFSVSRLGWPDIPYSFTIEHYNLHSNNEITIGCIGFGDHEPGHHVVWLRGSLRYIVLSNIKPTLHTSDYTDNDETYTVGTNYYGGSGNTNVNIIFIPQKTISSGPWHDGLVNGLFEMAQKDANGNTIVDTYATSTDIANAVTTNNLNATNLTVTGQTSVPTANQGNSSNAIASTEFVAKSISALVNGAPEQLNTLNELATALGNDSNFSATITAELGKKLDESEASDTYVTKTLWQSSQNNMGSMLYQFTNQLQRNKTYAVGDIAYSPSLPSWAYLECTTAGTTGAAEPDFSSVSTSGGAIADMTDGTAHWRVRDTRCRYEVGDIIAKTTTPKSYEYLLPCNGSAFDKTKYPMLAKIFTTGNVPDLTDGRFLEGSASAGTSKNAGLPNIIGSFKICGLSKGGLDSQDGAFSGGGVTYGDVCANNNDYPGGYERSGIGHFDASRYNSIYGLSDTVQPKSYTVQYYVCYGG